MNVTIRFSRTDDGRYLHFFRRFRASAEFVDGLRRMGASELTIAAAEGRVADLKRLSQNAE